MKVCHVALLLAGALSHPASASAATDLKSVAARLEATANASELNAITEEVDGERQAAVARLLDLLRGKSADAVKVRACYLVGALGDLSAANALIENIEIDYRTSGLLDERRITTGLLGPHPCASALVDFGPAVQDRLVGVIGNPTSVCQRDQALWVLYAIASSDGVANAVEEVEELLRRAMLRAKGGERTRLEAALSSLGSHPWNGSCPIKVAEEEGRASRHLPADEIVRTAERLQGAKSAAELDGILYGVEDDRQSLLRSLTALLASSSSVPAKARACFLLGQFHAPADERLIANLDLEWEGGKERHPCREALARAWRTGARLIMSTLSKDDDPVKRQELVKVMISWYGAPGAVARLSEAVRRETARGEKGLAGVLRLSQAVTIAQGSVK